MQNLTILRISGLVLLMFMAYVSSHAEGRPAHQAAKQRRDVVFVGTIDTDDKADSGRITFVLAEHGTKIKQLAFTMKGVKYDGGTSKECGEESSKEINITEDDKSFSAVLQKYNIKSIETTNSIEGKITSAGEAEGILTLERIMVTKEATQDVKLKDQKGSTMMFHLPSQTPVKLGMMKWRASTKKPNPKKRGLDLLIQMQKK